MPIDESRRSPSSREFIKDGEKWAHEDLGSFNPDRWLVRNEDGEIEYDSRAAPMQAFGGGVRGCYGTYHHYGNLLSVLGGFLTICIGKKLAYLETRIVYALIIWNLEILPPPTALFDFKAIDKINHQPQNVYLRLGDVPK